MNNIVLNKRTKDLTGARFGRLTVVEFNGYKNNSATWKCLCDCGKTKVLLAYNLLNGHTNSCGCLTGDTLRKTATKHGRYNDPLFKVWRKIKDRCYKEYSNRYNVYGAIGIGMSDEFKNDFSLFEKELGPKPDCNQRWTVDRIDCNKGYEAGNIRWATYEQQARNKTLSPANKTGVCGVFAVIKSDIVIAYCAIWREYDEIKGKITSRTKRFNVKKLGKDNAFKLACEYREAQILRLNSMGYGYSATHGKKRLLDD